MKILRTILILFLVIVPLLWVGAPDRAFGQDSTDATSAYGKYSNLLTTLYVPQDQGGYGDYYDWGYYTGTSYAGYSNLPVGYWVYVYPNWYIWGSLAPVGTPETTTPDVTTASVNGKYYNLLSTLYVPQDQEGYGNFYDWGYYSGTSYAGYSNLPVGYWVYVYPNWYIWGNKR
jgi:hypothetical protein